MLQDERPAAPPALSPMRQRGPRPLGKQPDLDFTLRRRQDRGSPDLRGWTDQVELELPRSRRGNRTAGRRSFPFAPHGAAGIRRAWRAAGGRSRDRKAKRSDSSSRVRISSIPSGIIESLLARTYLMFPRATASSVPPCIRRTTLSAPSSTTSPVSERPSRVTTVVV